MTTKQIVIAFAVLIVIGFIVGLARDSKPTVSIPIVTQQTTTPTNLCYYRSDKTANGLYDRAWMKMTVDGSKVTGEFRNVPAEKDSKVGTFAGTVSAIDGTTRLATVVWNSMAEGMQNKEELMVKFGATGAQAAFGEMIKGANGVYVYKDKAAAVYQTAIPAVDCATLDEIIAVEAYMKSADITAITNQKPILGGKFYTTSIVVDPTTHTALISYEDGHIAGKGTLTYTYTAGKVTAVSFAKAK